MEPELRSIGKLAAALARAQGVIDPPHKNRTVDFVDNKNRRIKYNYADLADVIESIRKPLAENELAITHRLELRESGYGMVTDLIHSSGESVSTWYPLPNPHDADIRPQEFGSALTYARRYSITALVGIASEEDDDGQAAPAAKPAAKPSSAPSPVKPAVVAPTPSPAPATTRFPGVTEAQRKRLHAFKTEYGWTDEQLKAHMRREFGIESSKELTRDQYDKLIAAIKATPIEPGGWDADTTT